MRIAFTAILYDKDPHHIQTRAMLDSAVRAGFTDFIIGVDSKSVEGTEEWVRKQNCEAFSFEWRDDFAWARNLTLERIPAECEWWGWADSDDTIEMLSGKTVQEILSDVPEKDKSGRPIGVIFFDYDYAQDEYGNSTTTHIKGRLYRHSTRGFPPGSPAFEIRPMRWEWRNRVHEDCYPLDGDFGVSLAVIANEEDLVWKHHIGDRESSYVRNMRILKKMLEDDPNEPRTWYYLGNQHFAQHEWQEAADAYEKYVGITGWDQEKWNALIYQGIAYQQLNKFTDALGSYTNAMLVKPELPDSYFGLGEVHTRMGDWNKGIYFGELGLQRVIAGTVPDKTVFFNANAYQYNPYLWLADCYWNTQDADSCLGALETAAKARPEPDLLSRIEHLKWAMSRERITRNGLDLAAGLIRRNEPLKAKAILDSLPAGSSERSDVQMARRVIAKETAHLYDDIQYRNFYFRSEGENADVLSLVDKPSGGLPRLDWEVRKLKGAKKVLQIGIGNGLEGLYLAKHGYEVVGIDINPMAVKESNWAAVKAGLMGTAIHRIASDEEAAEEGIEPTIETPDMTGPYKAYFSSFDKLDQKVIEQGPFDAVLATEIIEHVPDAEAFLRACDSLAPRVVITTPDGSWDGPQERHLDHVRAYSMKELASAIQNHGALVDLHVLGSQVTSMSGNIVAQYLPKTRFQGDQVVIYCGNTGQNWNPDSIHSGGIGGSETAVIRVAEELARRGFRVKVWAECEGIWNNVSYSLAEDFVPWECDLFVSWRQIGPIHKVPAKEKWIWSHDVWFGPATEEQLRGVKIIALSEWHRFFLKRMYPTAEIFVAGNGIDPQRFYRTGGVIHEDKTVTENNARIPHRLIYASSPDRGLNVVLRSWTKIKEKFPDATLDVFYGFDMARERNPEFIASIEDMAKQDGITLHGRVDQDRLAGEYLKADVLLYPSQQPDGEPFTETFCISVVEAQAAGCIPITPTYGALGETNHEGIQTDDLLAALEGFWKLPKQKQDARRRRAIEWAKDQTWERVVDLWLAVLMPVKAIA